MGRHRVLVLRFTVDPEALGKAFAVLTHDLAGRELCQGNRLGEQIRRPEPSEQLQIVARSAGLLGRDEPLADAAAIADRRIGQGLSAGRDRHLRITGLDRPCAVEEGLQGRNAGDRAGVGGAAVGELGPQHDLATEIRGGRVGDHRSHDQKIDDFWIDLRPVHETRNGHPAEVVRAEIGECRP